MFSGLKRIPGASLLQTHNGIFVFLAAIMLCIGRRPNQLNHPGVWIEEGFLFFEQYLAHGPAFLFVHVNGYVIIPSKVVALLAYLTSFEHYPAASFAYTLLISGLVAVAILKSPTFLKLRPLAALAPFLVPSDPEVIGIGEYMFWHTSLLAMLSVLWLPGAGRPVLRGILPPLAASPRP